MALQEWAFFQGEFVPREEARVDILTKGSEYGIQIFEGIRGFWDEERRGLWLVALHQHYERLHRGAPTLNLERKYSVGQLVDITLELLRRNKIRTDVYIRPKLYNAAIGVGVSLDGPTDLSLVTVPFGSYYRDETDVKAVFSSHRRISDNAIPARLKCSPAYLNSALAKHEAKLRGADEAILMTQDGHVSEFSAANLFIVRGNQIITPAVTEDILEGITRQVVKQIAEELSMDVIERQVDRTELTAAADEVFGCGTACNVFAVTQVDHVTIYSGKMGPITQDIREAYFRLVRGQEPAAPLTQQYTKFLPMG